MDGPMKESACERINLHLKKWSTILHRIFKEQTFERMEVWRNKPFASHLTCQFATIVATQMETSRFKVCDLCGLGQAWRTRILHVKNFSACCQLFHSIGQGVAQVAEYWATNQKFRIRIRLAALVAVIFVPLKPLKWFQYFFNLGLSLPLLGFFIFFLSSLFVLQLTNFDKGDRKQERRRRKSMYRAIPHSLEKAQRPAKIDSQQFWTEKAKPVPGFKPGLLRQNATAPLLAPPPRPLSDSNTSCCLEAREGHQNVLYWWYWYCLRMELQSLRANIIWALRQHVPLILKW